LKPTKAAAVVGVAETLLGLGIDTAADALAMNRTDPKGLYRGITRQNGVADAGATYFMMNLGVPGIKADTMILRFTSGALGLENVDAPTAKALIGDAAADLGVGLLDLTSRAGALRVLRLA
jgi:hypothetical protein